MRLHVECSQFAVGSLPDPVSEDDTPDPWNDSPEEAALKNSEDKGGSIESLSNEGVDDGSNSREHDVEDEEHQSKGWFNLHDGILAHAHSLVCFSHFFVFIYD